MDLRRLSTFLSMACWLLATPLEVHAQAGSTSLDSIVAVVNGKPISELDLQRRERFLSAQLARSQQAKPSAQELRAAVLERAIFETLMLQAANKQSLIPSDAAVQQTIADNAVQSGLTMTQFVSQVEQSGVAMSDYVTDVKNELAIASVRERALASKSKVSDAQVDRFLRENQSGVIQELALQVLLVPKQESASAQQIDFSRAQAQRLQALAITTTSEETFANLQKTVQLASSMKHEVNLGFRTIDKLPELYTSAVEAMAVGAVSPVLESSAGFYIVRLANKRTLLPQVSQTRARHILIRVDGNRADEDAAASQTIKKLHDRLTLNIDLFPALAKEFSQDGSASKGGDLGWAFPGDMVPEFERLMDVLKEGEMALPLRSQFGWHIVQVLERKMTDLPKERLRTQARSVLRARAQDEALGEWLEQLKAQAYIEYKR